MSAGKRVTSLWTKRVNLWLYWDIFRSELMHVDESRVTCSPLINTP